MSMCHNTFRLPLSVINVLLSVVLHSVTTVTVITVDSLTGVLVFTQCTKSFFLFLIYPLSKCFSGPLNLAIYSRRNAGCQLIMSH